MSLSFEPWGTRNNISHGDLALLSLGGWRVAARRNLCVVIGVSIIAGIWWAQGSGGPPRLTLRESLQVCLKQYGKQKDTAYRRLLEGQKSGRVQSLMRRLYF